MPSLCLHAGFLPLGVELAAWARIRKYFLHLLWKSVGSQSRAQFSAGWEWDRMILKWLGEHFWYYKDDRAVHVMWFSLFRHQNNQDRRRHFRGTLFVVSWTEIWASVILRAGVCGSEYRDVWVISDRACSGTRSSATVAERCSASRFGSVVLQFSRVEWFLKAERTQKGVLLLSRWVLQCPDSSESSEYQCSCAALFWKELWCWHGFWWVSGSFRGLTSCLGCFLPKWIAAESRWEAGSLAPSGTPSVVNSR